MNCFSIAKLEKRLAEEYDAAFVECEKNVRALYRRLAPEFKRHGIEISEASLRMRLRKIGVFNRPEFVFGPVVSDLIECLEPRSLVTHTRKQ